MRPSLPFPLPLLLGAVLAALLLAAPARADGFLIPTQPDRPVRGQWAVRYHDVDVVVRGPHARVTVDQEFVNLGASTLEAEYVFPLPHGAMVSSITLFENGKGLEGRLLRAEEARRIYEEIVRRQKDPALLEYLGGDFFRVRVFPIPGGGRRRVVLKYDQLLQSDAGTVELLYPLNTEKFSARPLEKVSVNVDLQVDAPLGPIYSPSHDVTVVRKAPESAHIRYEASDTLPQEDFLLYWDTTRNAIGGTLLTYWPHQDDRGYFLYLASPVLGTADDAAKPKEITLVVDTSGSMAGDKIDQVRAALRQVIGGLNPGDRFNVIAYHTAVMPLWPEVRPVDGAAQKEAFEFVSTLRAEGGTNIEAALSAALAGTGGGEMASVVLFLTDGRPTVGTTDADAILASVKAANPEGKARVFAFGVGVDVNTVLLDRLALENHGAPSFVRPGEDVEPKVASLYDKVRYPILTDLAFRAPGFRVSELLPETLPDLFKGGQVVLAGRYAKGGRVETILSGRDGHVTREYHTILEAAERGRGVRSDFPARVWATRRIAQLVDAIRLQKKADPELVGEIVRLSTRFGILTEYTAFLAAEEGDHTRVRENAIAAGRILDRLADREVGAGGVAQSKNQVARRGAERAPSAPTFWLPDADDRDVSTQTVSGVRQVGNRTFYRRSIGWVDAEVPGLHAAEETIARWSPRFFELLGTTTPEENARLSQAGSLVLEVQGRIVRIVER